MIFLRPLLLLLLFVPLLGWYVGKKRTLFNPWKKLIDPQLQPFVLRQIGNSVIRRHAGLLTLVWCLLTIAAAGPSFRSSPVPVARPVTGTAIVLDITAAMSPAQMQIARAKLYDLLTLLKQKGEAAALVLFDGQGYTAAPLTYDTDIIKQMVPSLSSAILPGQGSAPESGFQRAYDLLQQAQADSGRLVFITPGGSKTDVLEKLIQKYPSYPVAVLGIGNEQQGEPVVLANGDFLRDASGQPVLSWLDVSALSRLGVYRTYTPDQSDLEVLLKATDTNTFLSQPIDGVMQVPVDEGIYFVIACLPFILMLFRKGVFFIWLVSMAVVPVQAGFWQRPDQERYSVMQEGIQLYEAGDYEKAASVFTQVPDAEGFYNLGNAYAYAGQIQAALEAYEHVLTLNPGHEDAAHNKAWLEQQLKNESASSQTSEASEGISERQEDNTQENALSDAMSGNEQKEQNREPDTSESSQSEHQNQEAPSSDSASSSNAQAQAQGGPSQSRPEKQSNSGPSSHTASETQAQENSYASETRAGSGAQTQQGARGQEPSADTQEPSGQDAVGTDKASEFTSDPNESLTDSVSAQGEPQEKTNPSDSNHLTGADSEEMTTVDQESRQIFNLLAKDPARVLKYRLYKQYQGKY